MREKKRQTFMYNKRNVTENNRDAVKEQECYENKERKYIYIPVALCQI